MPLTVKQAWILQSEIQPEAIHLRRILQFTSSILMGQLYQFSLRLNPNSAAVGLVWQLANRSRKLVFAAAKRSALATRITRFCATGNNHREVITA